jgi:hypothetical protein
MTVAVGTHCCVGGSSQQCAKFQRAAVDLAQRLYLFVQPGITHLSEKFSFSLAIVFLPEIKHQPML